MSYAWLPPLFCADDFDTDQEYYDALYARFKTDFIETERHLNGFPIRIKRHPAYDGMFADKEATFRHLITEGKDEHARIIDRARCQTLGWMLPVLERAGEPDVHVWENHRQTNGCAYILSLSDYSYKLVLTRRADFLLLWTQFPVPFSHSRAKLRKEYESYKRTIKS